MSEERRAEMVGKNLVLSDGNLISIDCLGNYLCITSASHRFLFRPSFRFSVWRVDIPLIACSRLH